MSCPEPDFSYFFKSPKMVPVDFSRFTKGPPVIIPGEKATPLEKPFSYYINRYLGKHNCEIENEVSYSTDCIENSLASYEAETIPTLVDDNENFDDIHSEIVINTSASIADIVHLEETLVQDKKDTDICKKLSKSEQNKLLEDFVDNYIIECEDNEMFTREAHELFCEKYVYMEYTVFGKRLKATLDEKFGKDHFHGKKKVNPKYGTNPQKFYEGLKLDEE